MPGRKPDFKPEVGMVVLIDDKAPRCAGERVKIIAIDTPSWSKRLGGRRETCDVLRPNGIVAQMIPLHDIQSPAS